MSHVGYLPSKLEIRTSPYSPSATMGVPFTLHK